MDELSKSPIKGDSTDCFKARLLLTIIDLAGWEASVDKLIAQGANLSFRETPNSPSVFKKIETARGPQGLQKALEETPLDDSNQTHNILCELLKEKDKSSSKLIFGRILHPTKGPLWAKNPTTLGIIFQAVALHKESDFALQLADRINPAIILTRTENGIQLPPTSPLILACSVSEDLAVWRKVVEKLIKKDPALTIVGSNNRSAFYHLNARFPDIAKDCIETCSLEEDQPVLFTTLVSENFTQYANRLLERLESQESFSTFVNTVPITPEPKAYLLLLTFLSQKKRPKEIDQLYDRIIHEVLKLSPYIDTPNSLKARLVLALLSASKCEGKIDRLSKLGADLSYKGEDNESLIQKIEKNFGTRVALKLLAEIPTAGLAQTQTLLCDLNERKKTEAAHVLFNRLIDPKATYSWLKHPKLAARLFAIACAYNEKKIATSLIDHIDAVSPIEFPTGNSLTPLMITMISPLKKQTQITFIDILLKNRASLTATDNGGVAAFSYIHKTLPEKAQNIVELLPLEKDQSAFFSLLTRKEEFEPYLTSLFARLHSIQPAPKWWSGHAKAQLFMEVAPFSKTRENVKNIANTLIRDPDLFLRAMNTSNQSVLMVALEHNFEDEIIQTLLEKGSDLELLRCDGNGKSAFAYFMEKERNIPLSLPVLQNFQTPVDFNHKLCNTQKAP